MLGDLRDIFFCIVGREMALTWYGYSVEACSSYCPSVFGEGSNEIGRSQQY